MVASRSPHFSIGQRVFGALNEWRFLRGTLSERVCVRDYVFGDGKSQTFSANKASAHDRHFTTRVSEFVRESDEKIAWGPDVRAGRASEVFVLPRDAGAELVDARRRHVAIARDLDA